jgi:predicted protein tyrosine phosphatase
MGGGTIMNERKICFEFLISLDDYERRTISDKYEHLLRMNFDKCFEIPDGYIDFKIELNKFLKDIKSEVENEFKGIIPINRVRKLFELD